MKIEELKSVINSFPEDVGKHEVMIDFFGSYYPLNAFSSRMLTTEDGELFYDVDKHTDNNNLPKVPSLILSNEIEQELQESLEGERSE